MSEDTITRAKELVILERQITRLQIRLAELQARKESLLTLLGHGGVP